MKQTVLSIEEVRKLAARKPRKSRGKTKAEYAAWFASLPAVPPADAADRDRQRNLFERHDEAVFRLRLPLAPSINHYWRLLVRPGSRHAMTYISEEGQAYKAAVAAAWLARWKGWPPDALTGPLRLLVSVSYFNATRIDLDNRIKPLQDALTDCKVWTDDSQIDDLRAIRGPLAEKPGYMDVIVETMGGAK